MAEAEAAEVVVEVEVADSAAKTAVTADGAIVGRCPFPHLFAPPFHFLLPLSFVT